MEESKQEAQVASSSSASSSSASSSSAPRTVKVSRRQQARDKIPRAFDTLNRHIWYDQMKKNKERRVYTVVEHKVLVDPFFSRPTEFVSLQQGELHATQEPSLVDTMSSTAATAATASSFSSSSASASAPKRSRKSKKQNSDDLTASVVAISHPSVRPFSKPKISVELFC